MNGAYNADYIAAIEDAVMLGCGAINLRIPCVSIGQAKAQTILTSGVSGSAPTHSGEGLQRR